ncbi:tRNA pseudouridine(38-40) synthase TruA [Alicyclobacillus herbarius]|uniref:tRNA pseudouridine(38-40) synthase TruA n=1 Tax=Alicyclobacillus herbarius TaxID=122960 RepID=UPI00047A006D|nr:tRNA pseudouridine(38-40) synthase TruA [Alicyclobacillus herbarius]
MAKIRMVIAYDGTDFHGFARQRNLRTVQGTLEAALQRVLGIPVEVFGSGRTDAGVHARGQVVHFDQPYGPPAERYPFILGRLLPRDLMVVSAEEAPETFHARFSAVGKVYRYTLQRADEEDIFTRRYAWHVPGSLDESAMRRAADALIGEHDFTSFCAATTPVEDKRRNVYAIDFARRGTYLDIYCRGNGFLQYMVRIIVGTLVDVGHGRISPEQIPRILAARDRRLAGQTAPPYGLALWQVQYPS